MEWVQNYDPLGQPLLSSLLAGLPIFVLLGLLLAGTSAIRSAAAGLTAAVVVSITLFKMPRRPRRRPPPTVHALACCPSAGSCYRPCFFFSSRFARGNSRW